MAAVALLSFASVVSIPELGIPIHECGASVQMNPLTGLKPLQKKHYSWPWPATFYNSDKDYIDGVMHDYVRITGSCPLSLMPLNKTQFDMCAQIIAAVAAEGSPVPDLAVNYSPYLYKFGLKDPTVRGAPEEAELSYYTTQLTDLSTWLSSAAAPHLGAVLLDSEMFHFTEGSSAEYKAEITRKHDLIWNATRAAFPDPSVRVIMYDRGAVKKNDMQAEWTQNNAYTLDEQGESFSVALYSIPEIWNMRERLTRTVALAAAHNASGRARYVAPWLCFGGGYRRVANTSHTIISDLCWDYDRVYSWQMGREVNDPWFGDRASRYAPWNAAEVVANWPSVFDLRGMPAGPGGRSTQMMQHFVSYVRGANRLDGVAP